MTPTLLRAVALALILCVPHMALGHEMSFPPPISQPDSPVKLKSCYLGTNFMFGDPRLKSEETKMQLGADPLNVPKEFQQLGLRFEFGPEQKPTAKVVMFTRSVAHVHNIMAAPTGLDPSGYLPRMADYESYRCGVDFATSLDRKKSWFDSMALTVPCKAGDKRPIIDSPVLLSALEFYGGHIDAIFVTDLKHKAIFWSVLAGKTRSNTVDGFSRAIVRLPDGSAIIRTLRYGANMGNLNQTVCFKGVS